MRLSVIIPAINEQPSIAAAIQSAFEAGAAEVVVVDGGSSDDTVREASQSGARVALTSPGRASQMNHGARLSRGTVVLFLHADCRLPGNAVEQIEHAIASGFEWGYFQQRIGSPGLAFRLLEFGNGIRARIFRRVFGDQAMWVTRKTFFAVGGFPNEPLMEDVVISRRIGRICRPARITLPLAVSSRRWKRHGIIRQTIRNWWIQLRFRLGAKPADLVSSWRRHDSNPDPHQ